MDLPQQAVRNSELKRKYNQQMASRKGTLLERDVERLLNIVGLKPEVNKVYHTYEIDVFLRYNNKIIAFECKQYEKSALTIRNLIHLWDSKNKELKLDKIVLVIFGIDVKPADYQLAKKYGIVLWDEKKLKRLLDEAIENKKLYKEKLFKEIGVSLDKRKEIVGDNELKSNLKELIEQNSEKAIAEDRAHSYPIVLSISQNEKDLLIISSTRRNGFEIVYGEQNHNNLTKNTIDLFEDILKKYSFTERKRRDIRVHQFHITTSTITAALGDDVDLASEIITKILYDLGADTESLEFQYHDTSKTSGCAGCCGTGLVPTLVLFFPFMTILPSKKALFSIISFHQKYTSPKLANFNITCKYHLSCSNYGKKVIERHGAILGGWKTIGRLLRCTHKSKFNYYEEP